MPHEPRINHRTRAGRRPFDRQVDRRDDRRLIAVGRRLQPARPVLGMGRLVAAGRSRKPSRRGDQLLHLRHAEGADAADAGRVRHGRRAQLLLAGEDAGAACRQARGRRQRAGRGARHRHARSAPARPCRCSSASSARRAARRHLLVPDRRADGQRGGARPSVRAGRLEGGARPISPSASPSPSSPAGSSAGCISRAGWRNGFATSARAQSSCLRKQLTVVDRIKAGHRRRDARSSARSGCGSSPASPPAPSSTAMCPRTCWPRSWAGTPGGRCRPRC